MKAITALVFAATLSHAATQITWERKQLHGDFYSEGAAIGDINGDGKPDVVAGPFWWEGPAFEKKHAFYEPKIFSINGYSDNFFAYVYDFNGDKKNDILVLGFPGKEARLYLNPGTHDEKPWPMSIVADVVDNESPVFTDITGDGKPEIVCSTGGRLGYFEPNWDKPTEKWPFVAVSEDLKMGKFTHGLGVGDVDGDGKLDMLEARHWWKHADTGLWEQHSFAAGIGGGAQMFAYDFDGNGTNDVFTSLAAHRYGVAVYLQNKPAPNQPTWKQVMLASENPADNDYGIVFSQPHAAALADINGDGVKDIVVGKRYWAHNGHDPDEHGARVVYWYETKRDGKGGVDFIPHLVDANSGVGVDVTVGDVNGDGLPDIVSANKGGVFVLTQKRSDTTADVKPVKMYGPGLKPQTDYAHGQSPQDALKNLQLPTGFKADLIAAEPDIVQPIAFCFDERGRIWVLEGLSYPQPRKEGEGKDRIVILEDSNGDGTYETKKVFCEGINLGSGIEVGFGGVWVGAAPYLMFIPRDGDGPLPRLEGTERTKGTAGAKASPLLASFSSFTQVPGVTFTAYALLDGFGSQDTHETLNSFIWGPDGWLYGCHGVFTHSKIGKPGTPDDQRIPINAGVWRYHPVRHVFEVFAEGTSNPWGLDYDQNGEWFVTACVIPHLYHVVPGGRYQRQAGQPFNPYTYDDIKTIADHAHYSGNLRPDVTFDKTTGSGVMNNDTNAVGGGHAHCGLAIYQSSQFPADYRNKLIFGNLHGHRLVMDYLDPHGSTYIGKHGSDFMRSNDMNFIPVTQKVGPDGSLYVSDWSDKQVCHRGSGAVELWDRSNGRIYRIKYIGDGPNIGEEAKAFLAKLPMPKLDLAKESDEALATTAVQTENEWFSRMARRVLMERVANESASPASGDKPNRFSGILAKLNYTSKVPANSSAAIRLLWLDAALNPNQWLPAKADDTSTDQVIAQRVRLATSRYDFADTDMKVLQRLADKQPSPVIRREIASALQRIPNDQRTPIARALLAHGEDKDDPYIPLLIWYGIEPLVGADPKAGLELAKVSKLPKVTDFIYRRLATEPEGRNALLRVLAGLETDKNTAPAASGGTAPANGGSAAPRGGTAPRKGGVDAPSGGTAPANGGSAGPNGGVGASSGGTAARNGGAPIPSGGVAGARGGSGPASGASAPAEGGRPGSADLAPSTGFSPAERQQLLTAIVTAARSAGRQAAPADWATIAARLREGASPAVNDLVDELAALYGDAGVLARLRGLLTADKAAGRGRALPILMEVRDPDTAPLLIDLLAGHPDAATQRAIVQALAVLPHPRTPEVLVENFAGFDAGTKQDAVNTLATTATGAKALLTAVKAKTIPGTMLSPFLARQLAALNNADVAALLKETFGDLNAPKANLDEQKKKFRALLTKGDLAGADKAKGHVLFTAICGQCHSMFGEGQKVGPDLTGSNRGNLDYLLDNVLDPNAVIGKDYQLNIFELKDGRVASGVVKEDTPASVRIAMPGGLEQTITTSEIKKRTVSKVSTMPEGLFDALPVEQLRQLVAYLQTNASPDKGKGGPAMKVDGAIEGETLKVLSKTGGNPHVQGMAGFGGRWSNGAQLWWTGAKPNDVLTLALPVEKAGKFAVKTVLTKARDYGICDIALDGKLVLAGFDGYNSPSVVLSDELDLGTHDLAAGEHKLTFTIKGTNPQAVKSYMVGVDYVKLEAK